MSSQGTQFLFISHNKIAIEMAEQLVGRRSWSDDDLRDYVEKAARAGARTPWRPVLMIYTEYEKTLQSKSVRSGLDALMPLDAADIELELQPRSRAQHRQIGRAHV